jgi:hypothetical protein
MGTVMDVSDNKQFYSFYGTLNLLSDTYDIRTKNTKDKDKSNLLTIIKDRVLDKENAITTRQHNSDQLIKSFTYTKRTQPTLEIVLHIGEARTQTTVKITNKAEPESVGTTPVPGLISAAYDRLSLFSNYIDIPLNSKFSKDDAKTLCDTIENLFTYGVGGTNPYIWQTETHMLALFDKPFLLLTFNMIYYRYKRYDLFTPVFKLKKDDGTSPTQQKLSIESLIYIDEFSKNQPPTFLMLLIYYAGYDFGINPDDICDKFSNKFSQSPNGMSFDIKLYAPSPNRDEATCNNSVNSKIKPTSVNLEVEELVAYHVGGEISSLWEYVNGKLTILINNMLSDKTKVTHYKTLFSKTYYKNSLFLFECITELKTYKEYISSPEHFATIAYPLSTLKTLEILIIKLSYILTILEPDFIPLETMSFDVVMNGKTLKYVINSQLQATNISIDDYIPPNKIMAALDSLIYNMSAEWRGAVVTVSERNARFTNLLKKQAHYYNAMYIRKAMDHKIITRKIESLNKPITELQAKASKSTADEITLYTKQCELYNNEALAIWLKNIMDRVKAKSEKAKDLSKLDITSAADLDKAVKAFEDIIVPNSTEQSDFYRDDLTIQGIKPKYDAALANLKGKFPGASPPPMLGGGGKNTTKKVIRKQVQSKTKNKKQKR